MTCSPGRACVAALGLVMAACGSPPQREADRPVVVVSIFPVADLVAAVAGDAVEVRTLLPPRASPATWEATPSLVRTLSRADALVTVGGGLDDWLDEMGGDSGALPHLRLVDGLELQDAGHGGHGHGSGNPHVWLDPIRMRDHLLPAVEALLAGIAPGQEDGLRQRARAWGDSLTALDAEIREVLRDADGRQFVATHDAWGYFAERYGLASLGSLYERPGHEPSARGLAALVEEARRAGLTAVLAEPQLAESAARALAAEVGAAVVVVDPLGGPGLPGRERYCDLMRFNARSFEAALGGQ